MKQKLSKFEYTNIQVFWSIKKWSSRYVGRMAICNGWLRLFPWPIFSRASTPSPRPVCALCSKHPVLSRNLLKECGDLIYNKKYIFEYWVFILISDTELLKSFQVPSDKSSGGISCPDIWSLTPVSKGSWNLCKFLSDKNTGSNFYSN